MTTDPAGERGRAMFSDQCKSTAALVTRDLLFLFFSPLAPFTQKKEVSRNPRANRRIGRRPVTSAHPLEPARTARWPDAQLRMISIIKTHGDVGRSPAREVRRRLRLATVHDVLTTVRATLETSFFFLLAEADGLSNITDMIPVTRVVLLAVDLRATKKGGIRLDVSGRGQGGVSYNRSPQILYLLPM